MAMKAAPSPALPPATSSIEILDSSPCLDALDIATPDNFEWIAFSSFIWHRGPVLPDQAFEGFDCLTDWYRTVLGCWEDATSLIGNHWDRIQSRTHEDDAPMERFQRHMETSAIERELLCCGIRELQRRLVFTHGRPRSLRARSAEELRAWCKLVYMILDDDENLVSPTRYSITLFTQRVLDTWQEVVRANPDSGFELLSPERAEYVPDDPAFLGECTYGFRPEWISSNPDHPSTSFAPNPAGTDEYLQRWLDSDLKKTSCPISPEVLQQFANVAWRSMRELGLLTEPEPTITGAKDLYAAMDSVMIVLGQQSPDGADECIQVHQPEEGTDPPPLEARQKESELKKPNPSISELCNPGDTAPPEDFIAGPLEGNARQIGTWLGGAGTRPDREFHRLLSSESVWARKHKGSQLHEVFFKTLESYAKANRRKIADKPQSK